MTTDYTYSIANDFSNGVATDRLSKEIRDSAVQAALDGINTAGDVCTVMLKANITGDEDLLDALVDVHSGIALPSTALSVDVVGPKDDDGKLVVVQYPATDGFRTFMSSRGDDIVNHLHGEGANIVLEFTGADTKTVDVEFDNCIELHDGEVYWYPPPMASFIRDVTPVWSHTDEFSVGIIMPATPSVANGGGTGNANKVDIGGGINIFVPAAGDGAWDVDLDTAVPVPADSFSGGLLVYSGYWDCDYFVGTVTPSATLGSARFHLLDTEQSGWLIRNIGMGSPDGAMEIDVYKTEWIHLKWKLRLECVKASAGAGYISGWMMMFREPGA